MFAQLSQFIIRQRALALGVVFGLTAFFATQLVPLQYDFSFVTLFVGDGEDHRNLRLYLQRFGIDVNFVNVVLEADDPYSPEVYDVVREMTDELERFEGVSNVLSLATVEDLVGGGGELRTERIVPEPPPASPDAWDAIRERATAHPLYGGALFSENGEVISVLVQFGLENNDTQCSDGVDNDANGRADCHEPSCRSNPLITVCGPADAEVGNAACSNRIDDDGDGATDCADESCAEEPICGWVDSAESGRVACKDGLDNDEDGLIDCADADCARNPNVPYCNTSVAVMAFAERWEQELAERGLDIQLYLAGIPYVSEQYTRTVQHDITTFLPITGAIVALILFLLFRSIRGVVLPSLAVLFSVTWALGFMMVTGEKINMINSVLPTLLLVIVVADSIHIVSRYEEEAGSATSRVTAADRTLRRMLVACALTSVTSAVGFGSLATASLPVIQNFGIYAAAGILLGYAATILFVPATLSYLPLPKRRNEGRAVGGGLGERISDVIIDGAIKLVFEHRRIAWIGVAIVGVAIAYGMTQVHQNMRMLEELRDTHPAAVANSIVEEHLGGVLSGAIMIEGEPGDFARPEVLAALGEIEDYAVSWRDPRTGEALVSRATSIGDAIREAYADYRGVPMSDELPDSIAGVTMLLDMLPADARRRLVTADYAVGHITLSLYDKGSMSWTALRGELDQLVHEKLEPLGDFNVVFTGSSTLGQEAMTHMIRDLVTSLLLASLVIMLLMSLLFRSFRLGLLSMVPNMLPLGITFALLGFLGIPLRTSTAIVFSVSLGIAVDDTIHLLVRFREERLRTDDYHEALTRAMRGAGRAIVFTTVLLVIGFGALVFSDFTASRELGFLGGATLVAALFGDLIVLPLLLLRFPPKGSPARDPV